MAKKKKKKSFSSYSNNKFYQFSQVSPQEVHFAACQIFGSTHYISFDSLSSSSHL